MVAILLLMKWLNVVIDIDDDDERRDVGEVMMAWSVLTDIDDDSVTNVVAMMIQWSDVTWHWW